MDRIRLRAVAAAGLLWAVTGTACRTGPTRPNLLLITIDSLRWDHVGSYGYARDTTPRLDRFAARGARFERAIAQAPWTTPSMVSVMTSLYPAAHGVDEIVNRKVDPSLPTLAGILRENGYRTGAEVPFVTLWSYYGLNLGFDDYQEDYFDPDSLSSHFQTDRARSWIGRHAGGPFFYWVHYWDPHYNYRPSREVRGTFQPLEGSFGEKVFDIQELKWKEAPLTAEEVAYNINRYDEEILYTDSHVGRLLDFLAESGLEDDTLVVIHSDHGEQFQEHGWLEHTNRVYDHLIRVPLLFRWPGRIPAGLVIDRQVELVDLLPTLLELLEIPFPGDDFQGRSLASSLSGRGAGEAEGSFPAFSETDRLARLKTIRLEDWKYIHDFDSGRGELYRIDSDPDEVRDLAAAHPEKAAELRQALEAWLLRMPAAAAAGGSGPDPGMREKLCTMGYLQCED